MPKLTTLLIAALLGLSAAAAHKATAAPLTPEQARGIHLVAYGQCPNLAGMHDGCPRAWLAEVPALYLMAQDDLCAIYHREPGCQVLALYRDGSIWLSEDMDFGTVFAASVLLHEYLHHFQWLRRDRAPVLTCEEWLLLEAEAYLLQAHVLEMAADDKSARLVRYSASQLTCQSVER